jgi:nicotinamide-nucleotide amidase
MNAEIISIGDELLIGQVVNTNASWMAEQMNLAGFRIRRILAIGDAEEEILTSLREAGERSQVILITGGLGPTKDDITKQAICQFFDTRLVFNEEAYGYIERLFSLRGMKVTELNRKQAEFPEVAVPIQNKNGTAPGIWIKKEAEGQNPGAIYVFMPGVPFEMKPMLSDFVIPRLKDEFKSKTIVHKTVLTQGIGESFLSVLIEKWEDGLPENISLAYLPQPGIVRLRLSGTGEDAEELTRMVMDEVAKLEALIPKYIFGQDSDKLEEIIGKLLTSNGKTLATAESCTGGYISHLITSVPGSSNYFKGSVVAYSNEIKEKELDVEPDSLNQYGAVSEKVVSEMASGIRKRFNTDFAIATSGIAGPDGGTDEKPVGTTWIAIATPDGVTASLFLFGENRERNIRKTALQALNMLRKELFR